MPGLLQISQEGNMLGVPSQGKSWQISKKREDQSPFTLPLMERAAGNDVCQ
jgi:hypothetical protein